jgi:hypothetical protein
MRLPSTNPITLPFGATTDPYSSSSPHKGTDFSYLPDDTIYAPANGRVILHPNNGNDGNGVYMNSGPYFIGLLHTSKYLVSNGDTVKTGQPLAIMGATGLAYGKHLHFAVKLNNVFIDPISVTEISMDRGTVTNLYLAGWQRQPTQEELTAWVGKPMQDFFYGGGKNQYEYLWQQIRGRDAQLAALAQPTQLNSGVYKVA